MEFESLLDKVTNLPVFESTLLFAGDVDPRQIRVQLSRWVSAGKIIQLRRGVYTLAPRYRRVELHPFVAAGVLNRSSYISLQTALAYYDLIPENLTRILSVTAGRPETVSNNLGTYEFRRIGKKYFWGYQPFTLNGEVILMALPEKALLDLIYLTPRADDPAYLMELRLQNLQLLNPEILTGYAARFHSPKLDRAVTIIHTIIAEGGYEDL